RDTHFHRRSVAFAAAREQIQPGPEAGSGYPHVLSESDRYCVSLALVPLHELISGILTFVEPLQAQALFPENGCFETGPGLNFKIVECTTVRTQAVRDSGRKVNERAGFDFLEFVVHLDKAAALESHVAMCRSVGIRRRAFMNVVGRGAALVVVHLSG